MRFLLATALLSVAAMQPSAAVTQTSPDRQSYKVTVDRNGVMRRSDTKQEVSYYGTNYTVPFAHAYRALNALGVDHKAAIDRDVYHMKRLGFNGFRLHLWDVELADSLGNLQANDHLDLLDYLISQLEKAGIDIVLTAQTNFGNGYPEKNIDTGAFTYDFPKCGIHENLQAQKIQENYLTQLARHVNPYTGRSYGADNAIIAIEINNEPCHSGTPKEVTAYINRMARTLRRAGFDRPVLYNVSHNPQVTKAYYDADIQGTTYQWYPTGLVAGHERRGNFLPAVDSYPIPWKDTIPGYKKTARFVYEFDPGDVLYSHLYPAIARTFRKEGFQWITQFAYDPTDMARYNTEYQTHFLNLAYTPAKALSMMIAAEAARTLPRGADFGVFPNDTVFGDFTVSHRRDLSLLNDGIKYYHTAPTTEAPKNMTTLRQLAGVGGSPAVGYEGTGAYFLDQTDLPGVWRLEIMPDVMLTEDPFEKPSLHREVGKIVYRPHPMQINLPSLSGGFSYRAIDSGNSRRGKSQGNKFEAFPGVYLLSADSKAIDEAVADADFMSCYTAAFTAPAEEHVANSVVGKPKAAYLSDGSLKITATVFGTETPRTVTLYPGNVSFWRDDNTLFPMTAEGAFSYSAVIPAEALKGKKEFSYNIVVTENGHTASWPGAIEGTPLSWDYDGTDRFFVEIPGSSDFTVLLAPAADDKKLESAMIPESWNFRAMPELNAPAGDNAYRIVATPEQEGSLTLRRYVGDIDPAFLAGKRKINVKVGDTEGLSGAKVSLVGKNGATYSAVLPLTKIDNAGHSQTLSIPLSELQQGKTLIIPAPYPTFLPREVETAPMDFDPTAIDFVEITLPTTPGVEINATVLGVWLE